MRTLDFGGLFERYWPDVFRFAVYLTGNRADAEARALVRTKDLMRGGRWLRGVQAVATVLTLLALVRFYADTLEIFLVRLGVAAIAWALFAVLVLRARRRALRATTPPRGR